MLGFVPGAAVAFRGFRLFFFQAEDGIRDHCVTGVQTCALPICSLCWRRRYRSWKRCPGLLSLNSCQFCFVLAIMLYASCPQHGPLNRGLALSELRRIPLLGTRVNKDNKKAGSYGREPGRFGVD